VGAQPIGGDKIDIAVEFFTEIIVQGQKVIVRAGALFELNEHIDVTFGVGRISRSGAEKSDTPHSEALPKQGLLRSHMVEKVHVCRAGSHSSMRLGSR